MNFLSRCKECILWAVRWLRLALKHGVHCQNFIMLIQWWSGEDLVLPARQGKREQKSPTSASFVFLCEKHSIRTGSECNQTLLQLITAFICIINCNNYCRRLLNKREELNSTPRCQPSSNRKVRINGKRSQETIAAHTHLSSVFSPCLSLLCPLPTANYLCL